MGFARIVLSAFFSVSTTRFFGEKNHILELKRMRSLNEYDTKTNKESEGLGRGIVQSSSLGRKRVSLTDVFLVFGNDSDHGDDLQALNNTSPSKRRPLVQDYDKSIQDMSKELLIKIICGVEHDDLKNLILVSKAFRDATLIAKETHFAFTTPRKLIQPFFDIKTLSCLDDIEPPNAPMQSKRVRPRLSEKKLASVAVSLFPLFD